MNAHVTHAALADDIPIPFDWSEHDERPDCWCEPDVDVRTETDEELRDRIFEVDNQWGAYLSAVTEAHGVSLDSAAKVVHLTRITDVPVYLHRRPVEYDMVTGVGRVVSRL